MTDLERAFQVLGGFHEDTLTLCDLAADIDDDELSAAASVIREWVGVAGERVARLLPQANDRGSGHDPRKDSPLPQEV